MIGKVAPIMTYEMMMQKFYDEDEPVSLDNEIRSIEGNGSKPRVMPKESKFQEVDSHGDAQEKT